MSKKSFDFSGYATKNDLKCTDGRTIRKDAFKHNDGAKVPLVWQHLHNDPGNVLGHALLENREDGVYTYGVFNDTPAGQNAKSLVMHGDITGLSIYANQLVQKGKDVVHGAIREVSLVLSGANPGAFIDNLVVQHSDGEESTAETEAIIFMGENLQLEETLKHEEKEESIEHAADEDQTIQEVFDAMSEVQKNVVYALVAAAVDAEEDEEDVQHNDKGGQQVKKNVFDKESTKETQKDVLTHSQIQEIFADVQKHNGSLRESFFAHIATYGIENIDYLFPDAQNLLTSPELYKRDTEWVAGVINGTRHSPFSRIKTMYADLTAETARALGYVKGALKKEEVISLLKRTTNPTTIYKKQKLDRDDIVDITDLDVVAWLKAEMRLMLDEEIARAILIGDGREPESGDKIDETCIRPIYTDADMYAHHVELATTIETDELIDEIVKARKNYKGTGNPAFYTDTDTLTAMLLLKDSNGRRLYPTTAELAAALRVSKIVEVPLMADLTRTSGQNTVALKGIVVNLADYNVGANKGGGINLFDDFDIDYNQYKYLMETRISGALIRPKSALVIEQIVTP